MKQDTVLTKSGLKNTKPRISVLNILTSSKIPLTAEEIYFSSQKFDQSINLSTVYRILDTFLEKGIVLKPFIKDDSKACFILNRHQHKHYLICHECKKTIEIMNCPFQDFEHTIEDETNFTITNHKLEMIGVCPNCKSKQTKDYD